MIARRSFLRTALVAAAMAPVLPAVSTAAPAPGVSAPGVSAELKALIAEYQRLSAALASVDASTAAWDHAADATMAAADALVDYRPTTMAELAAKMEALRTFVATDLETVTYDVLVEDARALVKGGAR